MDINQPAPGDPRPARYRALRGRLIQLDEVADDAQIANDVLKRATEELYARELHSNEIATSTQNTIVLTTNNPFAVARDSGVDRRLVVVPFGRAGADSSVMRHEVENAIRAVADVYGADWTRHPVVVAYVVEQTINGYGRMTTGHKFGMDSDLLPVKVKDATAAFFDEADPVASSVDTVVEVTGDRDDRLTRSQITARVQVYMQKEYPGLDFEKTERNRVFRFLKERGATELATVRAEGHKGRGFAGVRFRDQQ